MKDLRTGLLHRMTVDFETMKVANTIVDSKRPVLKSFAARSPLMVSVTKGPATIDFQVVALDELSGVNFTSIMDTGPGPIYAMYNQTKVKFDAPVVGQSVNMTISVVIEPSFRYLSIQDDVFTTVHLAFLEQSLPFRVRGESRERSSV
jgi:hypothetical protein